MKVAEGDRADLRLDAVGVCARGCDRPATTRILAAAGVALLAIAAQACDRGSGNGDVSLRASKLLAPGNGPGVTTWGTAGTELGLSVARDATGNLYLTGHQDAPPGGGSVGTVIQKYG